MSYIPIVFSKRHLRDHVDSSSFKRGTEYEQKHRVLSCEYENLTVFGTVRGNAYVPYATDFILGETGIEASSCSCPLGEVCKHVVALGLAFLHKATGSYEGIWMSEKMKETTKVNVKRKTAPKRKKAVVATPTWQKSAQQWFSFEEREAASGTLPTTGRLQLMFRFERDPYVNLWESSSSLAQKWQLQIRPRVFYPQTGKTSLTDITWKQVTSQWFYQTFRVVSEQDILLLRQLADALGLMLYGTSGVWAPVRDPYARFVWNALTQTAQKGVVFLYGEKANQSVIFLETEPLRERLQLTEESNGDIATSFDFVKGETGEPIERFRIFPIGDPPAFVGYLSDSFSSSSKPSFVPVLTALGPIQHRTNVKNQRSSLRVPKSDRSTLETEYLPKLAKTFVIESQIPDLRVPTMVTPRLLITIQKSGAQGVRVKAQFSYEQNCLPLHHGKIFIETKKGMVILTQPETEQTLEARLFHTLSTFQEAIEKRVDSPSGSSVRVKSSFTLKAMAAARFLLETVPLLEQEEAIEIQKTDNLPSFEKSEAEPVVAFCVDASQDDSDWFDLQVNVSVGGATVAFAPLFAALSREEDELLLENGTYFSLRQPSFDRLRELIRQARELKPTEGGWQMSRFQVGWWETLEATGIVQEQADTWTQAVEDLRRLSSFSIQRETPPISLLASLRPYQEEGYAWLKFLYDRRLGGVLADDMGLGKTVQTIALLGKIIEEGKMKRIKAGPPFLIITPTSVVDTWDQEFERFAPSIRRVIFRRGSREQQYAQLPSCDVLVTSYALLIRDFNRLENIPFELVVLDEAQWIKNHQSKLYNLVRRLNAKRRIALTGTPLENNLFEFWSICSVAAPGLLGPPDYFKQTYPLPAEQPEISAASMECLRKKVAPFFLRRTKEHVEQDLPPKTEQILSIELSDAHKNIYDLHLQRERQNVLGLLSEGGMQKNRFQILKSLTRLRQIALHPGLVGSSHRSIPVEKLERLAWELSELSQGGHKALVFSQFTSFLAFVKKRLDAEKIPYAYLDGSTRNRQEIVRQFRDSKGPPVFLISLKAGGVGLNLIEADYCFVLDPWWNPAVECQAVDRAHRIGQTKNVFVYKMIAKGTIEEKVLALQEKKKKLFDSLFGGKDGFTAVTEEDVRKLLEE
ncbi:DEAD/DEAH box helicase [Candidatus Uhrbacteria bacterium]|nr:DEAD/DEAH box helicase [Candidatus Uhrbacteria bacterium]